MKEQEAVKHLRCLMFGLQRYRSITRENVLKTSDEGLGFTETQLAELWPWAFGEKCPLPALVKILDAVDDGKPLAPADYYNIITVFTHFIPEVLVATEISQQIDLPQEPEVEWLKGWER